MKTVSVPFGGQHTVAYFSMEVGLDSAMPTYAGGLGALAGDTLHAAADLGVPMAGVTLLHRKGYFRQHLDAQGHQSESPAVWHPEELLEAVPQRVSVPIEGREVQVRAWRYLVRGLSGEVVPLYLLDTAVQENSPWDQTLTDYLYGGDEHYRLCQEAVLGLGGVALLKAIGHRNVQSYHMNEGHSALLVLALLQEHTKGHAPTEHDIQAVRRRCVFTTHTPVPAAQDKFSMALARQVLGGQACSILEASQCVLGDVLNMTYLALRFSHYINGVSLRHEEISHTMFPSYPR